jgi:hypothetical protein
VGFVDAIESGRVSSDLLRKYDKEEYKHVTVACKEYIKSVDEIRDVVTWRNKVAAHFAITDPHEEDNPMTLETSIMYPVSYDAGRFRVGSWVPGVTYQDGTKHESEIPPWSLTEVHEKVSARYWPGFEYPSHPAS